MCGSYVSLTTALLVVNLGLGSVLAWMLPTVVGIPLIARRASLAARGVPANPAAWLGGGRRRP
jgi:hypothetical protein